MVSNPKVMKLIVRQDVIEITETAPTKHTKTPTKQANG